MLFTNNKQIVAVNSSSFRWGVPYSGILHIKFWSTLLYFVGSAGMEPRLPNTCKGLHWATLKPATSQLFLASLLPASTCDLTILPNYKIGQCKEVVIKAWTLRKSIRSKFLFYYHTTHYAPFSSHSAYLSCLTPSWLYGSFWNTRGM